MNAKVVRDLEGIVGAENVLSRPEEVEPYLTDETSPEVLPEICREVIVVRPKDTGEVSNVLRYAYEKGFPVVPRGGGTGLSGGSVPIKPSIILSLERMRRRIEVDRDNLIMTCEAGVTLGDIIQYLDENVKDLWFPLHPGDEGATIGGLAACNAGGARAVKYGVMRNYITGMTVVLPNGKVLKLGGKMVKNVMGYDLMQLLIGSEGTLGVITEVSIRLKPRPGETFTLIIPYNGADEAIGSVPPILRSGIVPLALEYVEEEAVRAGEKASGEKWPIHTGKAYLMIILEGRKQEELLEVSQRIAEICQEHGAIDVFVADGKSRQEQILKVRSLIYEGLKNNSVEILDVGVPISAIAEYVNESRRIAEKYGMKIVQYGHAGDGNVHQHPLKTGLAGDWKSFYPSFKEEIFSLAMRLGGTITAEHGVGSVKIKDMAMHLSEEERLLMKRIKEVFDPKNILNPGKVIE